MNSSAFFTHRKVVFLLASLCCLLWGSAYPAIKNGYALFGILPDDIPSKLVFAGYRFLFAGLILLVFASLNKKELFHFDRRTLGQITLLGLTQTSLQYLFFYVGLAHTTGVKSSIMNATGTFFSVLLAHFIYHNDRLSYNKVLGCVAGFIGVMVVNFGSGVMEFNFTLLGEGAVVMAALVLSAASIYGKKLSQNIDAVVLTGYQLTIGGIALLLIGFGMGGALTGFTFKSTALLVYLVVLSSAAFSLWTTLLKYNRVSMVTVFNFMIPIFGTLLSALFLNESFLEWKNALALVLVCLGIWLVTKEEKPAPAAAPPVQPPCSPARFVNNRSAPPPTKASMSSITLRFLAEPSTVNFGGKVHGGTVMKWIDEAGYACATSWSKRYCVTVFLGSIRFHRPIMIGDLVEVEARLAFTGTTSMNISVEVRSGDMKGGQMAKTTECLIVFVAVDSHGRPMPALHWNPETPGDIALAQRAKAHLDAARAANEPST